MSILYISNYDPSLRMSRPQTEHHLGRALLLEGIRDLYIPDADDNWLRAHIRPGLNGKPELPGTGIHFNITHCSGLVVCAFSRSPAGVDAENIRPFRDSILRRVLNPEEREAFDLFSDTYPKLRNEMFFRIWTLKESAVKQSGEGLSRPFTDIGFSDVIRLAQALYTPVDNVSSDSSGIWQKIHTTDMHKLKFFQTGTFPGYIISLCTEPDDSGAPTVHISNHENCD